MSDTEQAPQGRPPTPGQSAAQRAAAEAERDRYRKMPPAKRQAIVQTRDRGAQQAADRRRNAKHKTERRADARERQASYRQNGEFAQERKARAIANVAISTGKITRPATCEQCGQNPPVEMHHPDHRKPLEVVHLCANCHGAQHQTSGGGIPAHLQ